MKQQQPRVGKRRGVVKLDGIKPRAVMTADNNGSNNLKESYRKTQELNPKREGLLPNKGQTKRRQSGQQQAKSQNRVVWTDRRGRTHVNRGI